ncbi:MAG: thioredoxin-disulfide reductase [Candidatus Omnitrophica bacterium]|nr:thioredoxin-disulfide reductase [Candidatus Omnitrophota bacterium]
MSDIIYDVIVVGGAPAGLTAALYTSRENLNTLILEKAQCGGLPATTELIENYPGFPEGINGMELMQKFKEQAVRFQAQIKEFNEVKSVKPEGKIIKVATDNGEFQAHAVIVGSGSIPKPLGVSGEDKLRGRGVSYCATCDGPLFRGKDVAIIGCGNSGLQEGEALLKYVKSVTFVEFLPEMTASKVLQDRLKKHENAEFLLNHQLTAINGEGLVSSITLKDRSNGQEKQIPVAGVFMYVGFLPNSKFLENIVKLDKYGYIISDERMQTNIPGLYAVGDVRSKEIRQITVACAEGTIAAVAVRDYLKEL